MAATQITEGQNISAIKQNNEKYYLKDNEAREGLSDIISTQAHVSVDSGNENLIITIGTGVAQTPTKVVYSVIPFADTVYVYDGTSNSGTLLGTYGIGGDDYPAGQEEFHLTTNNLYFEFVGVVDDTDIYVINGSYVETSHGILVTFQGFPASIGFNN